MDYVAGHVKVEPALPAEYDWLVDRICPLVFAEEGLRAALPSRCRP
ncbi:hypothetical protein AB0L05_32200 [Nonomuraea pusilla]